MDNLQKRLVIAELEAETACANRELQCLGHWSTDHYERFSKIRKELGETTTVERHGVPSYNEVRSEIADRVQWSAVDDNHIISSRNVDEAAKAILSRLAPSGGGVTKCSCYRRCDRHAVVSFVDDIEGVSVHCCAYHARAYRKNPDTWRETALLTAPASDNGEVKP